MASKNRDEFSPDIKVRVAAASGYRCSNPDCRALTSGAGTEHPINVGEACHIRSAAPLGPRYDPTQSASDRASEANAIWLCRTCAKRIDADVVQHTVERLVAWRAEARAASACELGRPRVTDAAPTNAVRLSVIGLAPGCAWRELGPPPQRIFNLRFDGDPYDPANVARFHEMRPHERHAGGRPRGSRHPIVDITLVNDSPVSLLVTGVGLIPEKMWARPKGLSNVYVVKTFADYELTLVKMVLGERQVLKLPHPVHVSPGLALRYTLHLNGYRESLRGNESIVRFCALTDRGDLLSGPVYLGAY